jgi:hypothetical protein
MSQPVAVAWRNYDTQAIVDGNLKWETVAKLIIVEIFKQDDPAANSIIAAWVATLVHPRDNGQAMAFEDGGVWHSQNVIISRELKASGCRYGALGEQIPSFTTAFLTQLLRLGKDYKNEGWIG